MLAAIQKSCGDTKGVESFHPKSFSKYLVACAPSCGLATMSAQLVLDDSSQRFIILYKRMTSQHIRSDLRTLKEGQAEILDALHRLEEKVEQLLENQEKMQQQLDVIQHMWHETQSTPSRQPQQHPSYHTPPQPQQGYQSHSIQTEPT